MTIVDNFLHNTLIGQIILVTPWYVWLLSGIISVTFVVFIVPKIEDVLHHILLEDQVGESKK